MFYYRRRKFWLFVVAAATVTLLLTGGVMAQRDGPYDLFWYTVDVGGMMEMMGHSGPMGVAYALDGTAGQSDAGQMSGGGYTLGGGFWGGGVSDPPSALESGLYLPLILH